MKYTLEMLRYSTAPLLLAVTLMSVPVTSEAQAQNVPALAQGSTTLSEATIKALQEALGKQGIAVTANGVMNDETRNAIRKYQSQHHLPVTGEADKATLDKLGVVSQSGAAPATASTAGQAPSTPSGGAASPQMPMQSAPGASGMMSGPVMQGMMQGMMQSMQGMMGMMQGQMSSGQAPSESESRPDQRSGGLTRGPMMGGTMQGPMQRGGMRGPSGGTATGCAMAAGSEQSPGPAMMQMMQGMMQMMQVMQNQMQSMQRP